MEIVRRIAAGCAALAAAGALAACSADAQGPGAATPSSAYFPVERCINLANALNAPREGDWGYRIEPAHLRIIADAGFDTVRVLIDWHSHADSEPPYAVDPAYLARIDEVITQSFDAGLNVIIDMHDYLDLYTHPGMHGLRAVGIWRRIAAHYADWPPELIFEPVNEPRDTLSGAIWDALAVDLVEAIRETNPTRTIILGGDNWSSLSGMLRMRLPDDPYLVATYHYYTPHDFTHQGADWYDDAPPPGATWGGAREREILAGHLETAGQWAEDNRTPVFLGEFGVFRAADMDQRAGWTRAVREGAEAAGTPWCYFDFTAGFDAYDRATGRWIPEIAEALGTDAPPVLRR